jgi:hypothetical protein
LGERDPLVALGARAQEVPHFILHPATTRRRLDTFASPHGAWALFDASMSLVQMILQVAVRPMTPPFSQFRFEGSGIGIMSVGRHAFRDTAGEGSRGTEARSCCCPSTLLTQQDVNEVPITIAA